MPNLPVRDRSDAKLGGVCAALARAWEIDPLVLRVTFVVVALLTNGFALAVYALLWAILPERGGLTPLERLIPSSRSWSWGTLATVGLLVTALAAAATGTGPGAFVILALAWLILRFGFAGRRPGSAGERSPAPLPPPQTPFERTAQMWQQRLDNVEAGRPADWVPELDAPPDRPDLYGSTSPWDAPARDATKPGARRRGYRTWLGVLVTLGLTWAGLAIATALGVVVVPLGWAAATLVVLGGALLVTARPTRAVWGRPALLLPATLVAAVTTIGLLVPTQVQTPAVNAATDPALTQLPMGEHVIDLRERPVAEESLSYDLPIGDLTIDVPRTGNVVVRAGVTLGDLTMPDGFADGLDARREWRRITDPGAPTLTIDVTVGLGDVEVRS